MALTLAARGVHVADSTVAHAGLPVGSLTPDSLFLRRLRGLPGQPRVDRQMVLLFSGVRGSGAVKNFAAEHIIDRRFQESTTGLLATAPDAGPVRHPRRALPGLSQLSTNFFSPTAAGCMCKDASRWAAGWWCSPDCCSNSRGRSRTSRPSQTRYRGRGGGRVSRCWTP